MSGNRETGKLCVHSYGPTETSRADTTDANKRPPSISIYSETHLVAQNLNPQDTPSHRTHTLFLNFNTEEAGGLWLDVSM